MKYQLIQYNTITHFHPFLCPWLFFTPISPLPHRFNTLLKLRLIYLLTIVSNTFSPSWKISFPFSLSEMQSLHYPNLQSLMQNSRCIHYSRFYSPFRVEQSYFQYLNPDCPFSCSIMYTRSQAALARRRSRRRVFFNNYKKGWIQKETVYKNLAKCLAKEKFVVMLGMWRCPEDIVQQFEMDRQKVGITI